MLLYLNAVGDGLDVAHADPGVAVKTRFVQPCGAFSPITVPGAIHSSGRGWRSTVASPPPRLCPSREVGRRLSKAETAPVRPLMLTRKSRDCEKPDEPHVHGAGPDLGGLASVVPGF